jgi:heptosyltransferase-2
MKQKNTHSFPKTVILIRHVGIGDLIWHLPYIRAIAAQSRDGKVSVIAAPSTLAPSILAAEDCIEHVILYDRNPRRNETRKANHGGIIGMWRFSQELAKYRFDRAYLFSRRHHHAILARMAGIPIRAGFGTNAVQRHFLNAPPFIQKYKGEGVAVFEDATAFVLAHGITTERAIPKMKVPEADLDFGVKTLAGFNCPVVGFAIGTSETHKHWGDANYGALAKRLIDSGYGVVLLGGRGEEKSAKRIVDAVPPKDRSRILSLTDNTILQTAGVLRALACCVGNDTGVLNMAAANDRISICLLGKRPLLLHDPLIHCLNHAPLDQISVDSVMEAVTRLCPAQG